MGNPESGEFGQRGKDVDEVIAIVKEAIELYIEELQERGKTVPMTAILRNTL
ncbi:MAG: type II toxin-antitoxin system HicB family antitoxin [Chitinophagaceae bacterium]|nr:type II toxin-antitoxin system HicB family antitoxin [Chitinophagaceae bacterium]